MPTFSCQTCGTSFEIPQKTIDRYRGWTPRFCRKHSPKRKGKGSGRKGGSRSATATETLTPTQVLARYTGGPQDGVFTDGGSVPNPGPGGWGAVWVQGGEIVEERSGHEPQTTNNRMELRALIAAFRMLPDDATVTVWTDSKLCVNILEQWAAGWERRGWQRKTGPVENLDLVREAYELRRAHAECKVTWIAAHSGHRWNEYADALASAWRSAGS